MTDDWNRHGTDWTTGTAEVRMNDMDRACLYGDRAAAHLMFLLAAIVLGACLGCVVYGFIAWVAVCP